MNRSILHRAAMALIAPLCFALAACGGSGDDKGAANGDPIAKIAAPAGKSWAEVVEATPEGAFRMGNPDAPIKLIEYGSFTCPHCADFAQKSGTELRDDFVGSGRVSFEFRNLVRDPIDLAIARLVRCGAPESYFALTEQAFANQAAMFQTLQQAGEAVRLAESQPEGKRVAAFAQVAGLIDFFAARGIAKEQAATCLSDTAGITAIAKNSQDQSTELDIQSTPTFLINGQKADVSTWPELKAKLETMGAR